MNFLNKIFNKATVELEPTTKKDVTDIYAVPGYTIRLNVDNSGNFKNDNKAYQLIDPENTDQVAATFPVDSFIYFVLDKLSDRVYGSPPITSIRQELISDIKASKNVEAGTNSIKAGVVCVPNAPKTLLKDVIDRFASLCKRNARTKIVAVNRDGKFLDLSNLNPKDNIEIQKWLISKANIFNIPLFKLGLSEAGSLNAREQRDDFKSMIEALVKYELDKLNAILLFSKLGWNDVEIVCPNFATKLDYERTRIAVRLVNGHIITPNEAREIYLGLPRSSDPKADEIQFPKVDSTETPSKEKSVSDEKEYENKKEKEVPDMLDEALKIQEARIKSKKEKILDQLLREEDK